MIDSSMGSDRHTNGANLAVSGATLDSVSHTSNENKVKSREDETHVAPVSIFATPSQVDHIERVEKTAARKYTNNHRDISSSPRSSCVALAIASDTRRRFVPSLLPVAHDDLGIPMWLRARDKKLVYLSCLIEGCRQWWGFQSLDALKNHLNDKSVHRPRVKLTDAIEAINLCSLLPQEVRRDSVKPST